jgi:hypothetical protein
MTATTERLIIAMVDVMFLAGGAMLAWAMIHG